MQRRHIGLDLGVKSRSRVQICDEQGNFLGSGFYIFRDPQGLDYMMKKALEETSDDILVDITMEPTNVAWFPVMTYLRNHYPQVIIYRVKTEKAQMLRKLYRKHVKNDSLDAKALSKLPVVDSEYLEAFYFPPPEILALQTRCRQRTRLVQLSSSRQQSIMDQIELGFPHLMECFSSKFTSPFLRFCKDYINPFKVRRMGKERLRKILTRLGFRVDIPSLVEDIYKRAEDACILLGNEEVLDYDDFQDRIRSELRLYKSIQKELEKVDSRVQKFYHLCHPSKKIESLPGVGKHTAPTYIGIIADIGRFSSIRSLVGYFGWYPREDSSGNSQKKGLRMTKAGPNIGKRYLFISSDHARRYDPHLAKIYYEQIVLYGKHPNAALGHVGRGLLARMFRVLQEDREYILRDLQGNPISRAKGERIVEEYFTVPEKVRARICHRKRAPLKKKGRTKSPYVRGSLAPQMRVDSPLKIGLSLS